MAKEWPFCPHQTSNKAFYRHTKVATVLSPVWLISKYKYLYRYNTMTDKDQR